MKVKLEIPADMVQSTVYGDCLELDGAATCRYTFQQDTPTINITVCDVRQFNIQD